MAVVARGRSGEKARVDGVVLWGIVLAVASLTG